MPLVGGDNTLLGISDLVKLYARIPLSSNELKCKVSSKVNNLGVQEAALALKSGIGR